VTPIDLGFIARQHKRADARIHLRSVQADGEDLCPRKNFLDVRKARHHSGGRSHEYRTIGPKLAEESIWFTTHILEEEFHFLSGLAGVNRIVLLQKRHCSYSSCLVKAFSDIR